MDEKSMKEYYDEFQKEKNAIFNKNEVCKKIYSVDFILINAESASLDEKIANIQARKPGPLVVFSFIKGNSILLRFESLCVILDISIAIKLQPFEDTEYLPNDEKDIKQMAQLYKTINLSKYQDQYFHNFSSDIECNQPLFKYKNDFYKMTVKPLFWYLIKRYDYPTKKFQDSSFFDFYSGFINKKKKTFIQFEKEDFIQLHSIHNHYHKCIYKPNFHVLVYKNHEENRIDNEINFYKNHYCPTFVKCYGYFTEHGGCKKLVFEYMPIQNFIEYQKEADNCSKLITFCRLCYSLDYLHSNGFIFRVLKDSKILLNNNGLAFLHNFGYIVEEGNTNINDVVIGVPKYMPPEQNMGICTYKSDVYSFGKLMHFLFNGSNNNNIRYGLLSDVIDQCFKVSNERPTMKEIINKIDNIIDDFQMDQSDKQKVKKHNKDFIIESTKYINAKSLIKNCNDSFIENLFDINFYRVDSIDSDLNILDYFFNNSFSPFITCDVQTIDQSKYLIIGFELSCLVANFSVFEENDHFYLKKLLNAMASKVQIYPISKEKLQLISELFHDKNIIINDDIFYEMVEKIISLSTEKVQSIPMILQKIFPSLIGYSIKRFYFKKNQFNDPYFFDYTKIQENIKHNKLRPEDFYCLKVFYENRFIVYHKSLNQLFMVIKNNTEHCSIKSQNLHFLAYYIGSLNQILTINTNPMKRIKSQKFFYHFYEIVGDYTFYFYLNNKINFFNDPTFKTKILSGILFVFNFVSKQSSFNEVSRFLINTKYIFFDNLNNVKIAFPDFYEYDTFDDNMKMIGLILLSFFYNKNFIFYNKNLPLENKLKIPENLYPLYYIYRLCFYYKEELDDNCSKKNLVSDILRLINNDPCLFESVNQTVISKEFAKFKKYDSNLFDKSCIISTKIKSETFFKDLSLPKVFKDFNIYHLNSNKGFLCDEILNQNNFSFGTFYLNKISEIMRFVFTFQNISIICKLDENPVFLNIFLKKWENKTLFSIDENSSKYFEELFPSIYQNAKIISDKKLIYTIPSIYREIYRQKNTNEIVNGCIQTILLYLIKRFDYNDMSLIKSPTNSFTLFNQNDFYTLYSIGHGDTSKINLVIHKQTFHLFALKQFYPIYEKNYNKELEVYSENFNDFSPFITKCYGNIRLSSTLIFEYMPLGNLSQVRMNKLVDDTLKTKIMLRTLASLEYLHSKGIIYKDIKPENIIFNQELEPFLCDLGAVSLNNEITFMSGNLLYAAPEFSNKIKSDNPKKIDIYSFGKLLFYMCCENEDSLSKVNNDSINKFPDSCYAIQEVYWQCTQEDPNRRLDSIDLLFDIIYHEKYFPATNKKKIKQLIFTIVENNFKNNIIYKPFFYAKGISCEKDVERAEELIIENEEKIIDNNYLCFELGNFFLDINNYKKALKYYSIAAENKNDKAINMLGILYFRGRIFKKDFSKSIEIFNEIKEINSDALNNYAYSLLYGLDRPQKKDIDNAINIFNQAIEKYNKKESYLNLGDIYSGLFKTRNLYSIETDIEKSIKYYIAATKFNYDVPFIRLGDLCIKKNAVIHAKDSNYYYQEALKINNSIENYIHIYNQSSNDKFDCCDELMIDCLLNLKKFSNLGFFYFKKNDFISAKKYFHLASKESDSCSQNCLGFIYFKEEIKKSFLTEKSLSLKYFKKAAKDKQNSSAQFNLGLIYYQYSNLKVKSIRKSIHFLSVAANKGHFKANLKLGQIYEKIQCIQKSTYYYEKALKINQKSSFLYNKLGIIYLIGNDKSKSKEYFEKAYDMNFLLARNNFAVLLMNIFKRESDIKNAYGIFYALHKYNNFILASCNIGFYYESCGKIYDSIPFFEKALLNFKNDILEKNRFLVIKEEQDCLNIIIFLVYLMVLYYYLTDVFFINSKSLFNYHFNDVLTFYKKYKFHVILDEINIKYDVDIINQIGPHFDKYLKNKMSQVEFNFSEENKLKFLHALNVQIRVFKQEIRNNNYEILFLSRRKNNNQRINKSISIFYSSLFDIPSNKSTFSMVDFVKNIVSKECTQYDFPAPLYFRFGELFPKEVILSEIFSQFNFVFIQKVDSKIVDKIIKISKNAKYLFYNRKEEVLTFIINNYFFYFLIDSQIQLNSIQNQFFLLFSDIQKIDMESAKQLIGDKYDIYITTMNNFILEDKEILKKFLSQIYFYSILFHRFNSIQIESELKKIDIIDLIKLKRIDKNRFKVIHIETNLVFILKENSNKENQKNEIHFYSEFKIFQEKMIIPFLYGKVENEHSLLFEYSENFSDFFDNKWTKINDTEKTIIVIKMIYLLNLLHSHNFIICGLEMSSFLIKENLNGSYNLYIDDLFHFLQQDYTVSSKSEFVSPEIKKCHLNPNLNLPVSYHSDIFSIGKILELLGFPSNNDIVQLCLSENPENRPNSLFLLIKLYCNENYFPEADSKNVNDFVKSLLNDENLFENSHRMDIVYFINNCQRFQNLDSFKGADFDVLISLLHAKLNDNFIEVSNQKIRDFFSSDECFSEFQKIYNNFN